MTTSRLWSAVLLAASVLLVPAIARADDPCAIAPDWKNLATCTLGAGRNVTIGPAGCGPNVYVDHTTQAALGAPLGVVTIASGGRLVFADEAGQNAALDVGVIDVEGAAGAPGTLQIGAPACPMAHGTATITFHGDKTSPTVDGGMSGPLSKGILVGQHGALVLYGAKGVTPIDDAPGRSWTHLAAPAGPETGFTAADGVSSPVPAGGSKTLQLATAVDWEAGDWIVVATTDFVPYSSEFVRIASVTANGDGTTTVTLHDETPLVNYHFGGPAPSTGTIPAGQPNAGLPASFADGPERNWGVDERAEVGLVSRRVKLTAAMGSDLHWGGEVRIMPGFARVEIEGVEIEKFGKDQTGSYPLHFHMAGDVADAPVVNSNTIHHSFNKCVTVHYTDHLTIANTVCARIVDHAFYIESQANSKDASTSCQMQARVPASGNVFTGNLAVSVMSNGFTLSPDAADPSRWFAGDYVANGTHTDASHGVPNGYDGFGIPSTTCDDQAAQPVPSGFWITNPSNHFRGNSVAGCQGMGRGYWLLPTIDTSAPNDQTRDSLNEPLVEFAGNRAHGCALGLDSGADLGVGGDRGVVGFANFEPLDDKSQDVLARVDDFTATRNRDRGVWLRDKFYHVAGARLANNRDSISLVSGGGPESSKPGIWSLLTDSVVVGETRNNPGRFGDCPLKGSDNNNGHSCAEVDAAALGKGYPDGRWNAFGFMFYDGPARLETVRFVNFKRDITEFLTAADLRYLALFAGPNVYEGDAALGWFQSNKNAYPPTQYTEGLSWENVDFRHQVYTENVNVGDFSDGDKNTVILDRDGTLSGFKVVGADCQAGAPPCPALPRKFPISLNNLGFNSTPWSVDECHAEGAQDAVKEFRPSALMSPHDIAGLEVSFPITKDPPPAGPHVTFWRDTTDFCTPGTSCEHQSMTLVGRNDTYTYEPKVIGQLGYTMSVDQPVPSVVGVGLVDAHAAEPLSVDKPFRVRLGICYRTANGAPSAEDGKSFTVLRGRKSWGSPSESAGSLTAAGLYRQRGCNNLIFKRPLPKPPKFDNLDLCPSPEEPPKAGDDPVSTDSLEPAASLEALDSDSYFYDADVGMLYLYVEETTEGAGPSPLGSCPGDAEACKVQSWYQCPPNGCRYYKVTAPSSYAPSGATACDPYAKGKPYVQTEYPADMSRLAYAVPAGESAGVADGELVEPVANLTHAQFPHNETPAGKEPWCPTTWVGPLPSSSSCDVQAPAGLVEASGLPPAEVCTAFLPRSIGFGARRASGRSAPIVTAWDWIGAGSYELRGPLSMVSAEDQGGVELDPARAHYLAYDMALRSSETSAGVREGIVVSDELGAHVVDTRGAERLLLPAGVSLDGSVPAARGPLWDTYTCHRVARRGKRRAGKATLSYSDASGTHRVRVSAEPRRLCVESDVGDGLGDERTNVTCYPIKRWLAGGRPSRRRRLDLDATDRLGTLDVVRRAPAEICLPATVDDRGR